MFFLLNSSQILNFQSFINLFRMKLIFPQIINQMSQQKIYILIMILKQIAQRWYHIRKPRLVTQNKTSLQVYRDTLREARKKVHIEAKQYQQMIEDQYLQKHAQKMKSKHFNNQCDFRKKIAQQGFRLQLNLQAWKKQDQKTNQKFNKYLHNEDLKRMNRQRIKKIMTFESENYWYTSKNAEQRLTDEVIFPQYVASTQYYHRLHAEALVYENYDFNMLHRVRSNEEVIKQKNKILIPIFNSIKLKIKQYKTDKEKEITYLHQIALDKINLLQNVSDSQRNKLIQEQNKDHTKKMAQFKDRLSDPVKRQNYIKQKLRVLLSILGSWKQYTNILGMTSGQMMKEIQEARRQSNISTIRQNVMTQIRSVKNTTFIDAIQEDTEDVQITLEDYISKLKAQDIQQEDGVNQKQAVQVIELDGLLKQAEDSLKASKADLTKPRQQTLKLDLGSMVSGIENPTQFETTQIPVAFLNVNQTTSSVQVMKEVYQKDEQMIKLLNQIGQVSVEYPKLFQSIWKNTYTVV